MDRIGDGHRTVGTVPVSFRFWTPALRPSPCRPPCPSGRPPPSAPLGLHVENRVHVPVVVGVLPGVEGVVVLRLLPEEPPGDGLVPAERGPHGFHPVLAHVHGVDEGRGHLLGAEGLGVRAVGAVWVQEPLQEGGQAGGHLSEVHGGSDDQGVGLPASVEDPCEIVFHIASVVLDADAFAAEAAPASGVLIVVEVHRLGVRTGGGRALQGVGHEGGGVPSLAGASVDTYHEHGCDIDDRLYRSKHREFKALKLLTGLSCSCWGKYGTWNLSVVI